MDDTRLDALSNLLLEIYRLSAEAPLEAYQDEVLRLIKPLLGFDSCMWGVATYQPEQGMDIHAIHLHEQSNDMLLEYEPLKHLDVAAAEVAGRPHFLRDFHCPSLFGSGEARAYRDFQRRHGIGGVVISGHTDATTGATQWLSLFREEADRQPSETQMRLLARLSPHLMQSLRHNRIRHLLAPVHLHGGAGDGAVAPRREAAIVDARGVLHYATPGCEALLRQEWSGVWRVGHLPDALLAWLCEREAPFVGHALVARRDIRQDLLFVHLRPRCAADALTPRQLEIAGLMTQGLSHKEAAQRLGLAPGTVRKQIQNIYDRLQVNSVAGLIGALQLVR